MSTPLFATIPTTNHSSSVHTSPVAIDQADHNDNDPLLHKESITASNLTPFGDAVEWTIPFADEQIEGSIEGKSDACYDLSPHDCIKYTRKGKRGAKNQNRHRIFLRWILQTFHQQMESSMNRQNEMIRNHGLIPFEKTDRPFILDIAGGKGELTTRLCICHSIQSVLIDPRPADLPLCFEKVVFKTLPTKWKESISCQLQSNISFISEKLQSMSHQLVVHFDAYRVESCPELQWAVQNASLLVGLHADGATEDIVDVALKYRKPFVVVPCCVFPNLYKRWIDTSSQTSSPDTKPISVPVRQYDQFCDYLLRKDSHFQKETLPFEGRNLAIWWDGKLCDQDMISDCG